MPDEPTLGEVMRRLDAVSRTLGDIAQQMREDRQHAAATYVRRDVFDEARRADQSAVREVAKDLDTMEVDRKKNADFRRQMGLALAVCVLGIFGSVGISLFNLLMGGA